MSNSKQIHEALKSLHMFDDLSDAAKQELISVGRLENYHVDELIINENEKGDHIYLILHGSVEIIKASQQEETSHLLAKLDRLSWFGEIALFNQEERSASVRTKEPTTVAAFSFRELKTLHHGQAIIRTILAHIATQRSVHLKGANEQLLEAVRQELKTTKLHEEVGKFIIYTFVLFTVFVFMMKTIQNYGEKGTFQYFINSFLIVLIGIWAFITVKGSSYPLEFYGISWKNAYKNAKEAVWLTLPFLLFFTVLKLGLIKYVDRFHHLNLFGPGQTASFFDRLFTSSPHEGIYWLWLGAYTLLVPVQELIIRGCVQSCLTQFFRSSHRVLLSIVVSNLLFMTFHNLGSFKFSLFAGFFGLVWGWLYHKQKTLVGPIVSHAIGGFYVLGILNYGAILA